MQLSAIQRGVDPRGLAYYVLPHMPGTRNFWIAWDVVRHPDVWQHREQSIVPGADSMHAVEIMRDNFVLNKPVGEPDWSELWGSEEGKTCCLVSAGQSLEQAEVELDQKRRKKDEYFLLGINRAYKSRIALKYYLVVDLHCGRDWIERENLECILIAGTTAKWEVCKWFKHRYWGDTKAAGVDCGKTIISTGMLITLCDAMHAAYKLGAKRIELYGCDFSTPVGVDGEGNVTAGNYYHDMGLKEWLGEKGQHKLQDFQAVGDTTGQMVLVSPKLWVQACAAAAMADMLAGADVEVVNCTPGGILHEGTKQ